MVRILRPALSILPALTIFFVSTALVSAQTFTDRTDLVVAQTDPFSETLGLSISDFNGDGRLDVYYTPGYMLRQAVDGHFENVFGQNGIDAEGELPHGTVWGDANGDGLLEVLMMNRGGAMDSGSRLYRNLGGERFFSSFDPLHIHITEPGVQGAAWRDFDQDGRLDLLAGMTSGVPYLYSRQTDAFVYTNITSDINLFMNAPLCGMAVEDYDLDGDPDLYSMGCSSQRLLENDLNGSGRFIDRTAGSGISRVELATASLWADFDNDGLPDLYVAGDKAPVDDNNPLPNARDYLYRNLGDGRFQDITEVAGLTRGNEPRTTAVVAEDFDNDGWLDLFLAQEAETEYFHNDGDGTFTQVTVPELSGIPLGAAMAAGDLDDDGWMDLFIADRFGNVLLMNDGGTNNMLNVQARADKNFYGVGSRITVRVGTLEQTRVIVAGTGNRQQSDRLTAHFGLGTAASADLVRIQWPDGTIDEFTNVAADQTITVEKGRGVNSPPTAFSIVEPAPSAYLPTSQSNIHFDWEDSLDPDDPVSYTLFIYSSDDSLRFDGLTTSAHNVPAELLIPNSVYSWSVVARGGNSLAATAKPFHFSFGLPDRALNLAMEPTNTDIGAPGLSEGTIKLADFDADGDMDLFTGGTRQDGTTYFQMFTADTTHMDLLEDHPRDSFFSTSYVLLYGGFSPIQSPVLAIGDRDLDGDLDVVLSGRAGIDGLPQTQYYQFNGTTFLPEALPEVTPLWGGDADWVDVNDDGNPDLVIAGARNPLPPYQTAFSVYLGSGNSQPLTTFQTDLPGLIFGDFEFNDMDQDGDLDVALTGDRGNGEYFSAIYVNNGSGSFSKLPVELPGLSHGSVSWGDFDGDGLSDLLLTGGALSPEFQRGVMSIYRNEGNGGFSLISAPIENLVMGEARWVDYDIDGDLDLFIVGSPSVEGIPKAQLLLNEGGRFVPELDLDGVRFPSVEIGDYNSDGDPDIIFLGKSDLDEAKFYFYVNPIHPEIVPINR